MKKRLIIPLSLLAAAIMISFVAFSGCDPLEVEGPELVNSAPRVSWAISPSDSMVHSFNPALRWVGTDQDGQINDYIYGVFEGDYIDSVARETSLEIPDTLTWVSVGLVTSATIPLFASPDSSDTIGQYVVLRGIDDQGDSSNIINRYLMRANNRPTCIVTVPDEPEWVLPETTGTWGGIAISWEGGDSLDYTGAQPDFLWEVRIYGPYADSASAHDDTVDFDENSAPLYERLQDEDEDSLRVEFTAYSFTDLVTGFYIAYVRNYDDANVPSRPALGIFEVYEPHWIRHPNEAKDILLYNSSTFNPLPGNLPMGAGWGDSIQQFYTDVIDNAGIAPDKWDWFDTIPTIRELYLYRLVIIDDVDWSQEVSNTTQEAFIDYMDAGGMIWVIGRMSFFNTTTFEGLYEYEGNDLEPLVFDYIGLEAAYFPPFSATYAEFIGSDALNASATGLPSIDVDTSKVQELNGTFTDAIPRMEFLVRTARAEVIYTFVSNEPSAAGSFHNFPVAVRAETPSFKASYFCFPLFLMEYDAAAEAVDLMLEWFLD
jgi:hypothetical protein